MTGIYSVLHLLVDGVCALAMFGHFSVNGKWYIYLLLYNFCAFAMQMPLGVVLDGLNSKKRKRKYSPNVVFAVLGVVLTLIGVVTHPVLLGLGNALFHLGGGVGTIEEDTAKEWQGRGLGVFVAPGAIGLYIGTQLAKSGGSVWGIAIAGALMLAFCIAGKLILDKNSQKVFDEKSGSNGMETQALMKKKDYLGGSHNGYKNYKKISLLLVGGCFSVVVLRSYLGMVISFPWKTTLIAGVLAVLAIALGKMSGGFLAGCLGWKKASLISLGLAAVCYLFSQSMPLGLFALFFFNMTMPITLYLLVQELKELPGLAFGILTFGLFLGFLPEYFGMDKPAAGTFLGCVGSLLSMMILSICVQEEQGKELQ